MPPERKPEKRNEAKGLAVALTVGSSDIRYNEIGDPSLRSGRFADSSLTRISHNDLAAETFIAGKCVNQLSGRSMLRPYVSK